MQQIANCKRCSHRKFRSTNNLHQNMHQPLPLQQAHFPRELRLLERQLDHIQTLPRVIPEQRPQIRVRRLVLPGAHGMHRLQTPQDIMLHSRHVRLRDLPARIPQPRQGRRHVHQHRVAQPVVVRRQLAQQFREGGRVVADGFGCHVDPRVVQALASADS